VVDRKDEHDALVGIDAINDPVIASMRTMATLELESKRSAHSLRVLC
jgi:hypothetical protein